MIFVPLNFNLWEQHHLNHDASNFLNKIRRKNASWLLGLGVMEDS